MKKLLFIAIPFISAHVHGMDQEVRNEEEAVTQQIEALDLNPPQQAPQLDPQQAAIAERVNDIKTKIAGFLVDVREYNKGLHPYVFIQAALYYWNHAKKLYNEAPNPLTKELVRYARNVFYTLYEKQLGDLMDIEFEQLYKDQQQAVIDQLTQLLADYYVTVLEDPLAKAETKEFLQESLTIARQNAGLEN